MENNKKMVLGFLVISIFIFLTTVLVFVYELSGKPEEIPVMFRPFLQYHIEFMVLMGLFGLFSGIILYSTTNSTIEKQKKMAKANINIILKFLGGDDKSIMQLLLEKGGMTTQSEIANLNNMGRLRAHRAVRKLEDRGIIHTEKHGKINLLRLNEELKQE